MCVYEDESMTGKPNNMFYSQMLLSKKGALGIIWIAAHCHRKLKKDQVFQTNIVSSVEIILKDAVPTVTHRILAYLLIGVVRIYSKKFEYLADDCLNMLTKLKDIPKAKRANIRLESLRSPHQSIILPERFELDAFNLEGLEILDLNSDHRARSRKEIMLEDTMADEILGFHSYNKYYEGSSSHSEVHVTSHTPVKNVLSPHFMDIDIDICPSRDTRDLKIGLENVKKSMFLLDDRLEPMAFEDSELEGSLHGLFERDMQTGGGQINMEIVHERIPSRDITNLKMGLGNINKSMFVLDDRDRMGPMTFEDPENEGGLDNLFEDEIQTGGEQINIVNINESGVFLEEHVQPSSFGDAEKRSGIDGLPDKKIHTDANNSCTDIYPEEEPAAITKSVSTQKNLETEILQNPVVTSSESRVSQTPKDHHVPITFNVTPQSKFKAPSVEALPEVMAIPTPAAKEHKRITQNQKWKCSYDDQSVVPNEIYKCWIKDSSDLVCKRRKVPHTAFRVYEAQKIARLPGSLLEPLIPCNSLAFRHLITGRTYRSGKGYQPASSSSVEQNQSISSLSKEKHQVDPSLSSEQLQTAPLLFEEQNKTAPLLSEEQNQTTPSFPDEQNPSAPLIEEHNQTSSLLAEQQNQVSPSLADERGLTAPSVSGVQERAIPSSSVHSTFVEFPELQDVHGLEILEPGTPEGNIEKFRSPSDEEKLEFDSADEEINSYEGDGNEKNHLSVRTRKVAGYLCKRFAHREREGDEVIKLSRIVKGKDKKESATLFYEILVLKTKDYINVMQKNAYDDIQVMQTPALKKAFGVEGLNYLMLGRNCSD